MITTMPYQSANISTHPNVIIDNPHEKPTFENVYRTKSGRIVKKTKRYIPEMRYDLFLISGLIINKPKQFVKPNVIGFI